MKKFISRIRAFTIILTIVVVSFTGGIYFIQSKASFKLPPDKHILIIGDSHTQVTIDDKIYRHAVNVSQGGTAYLYSYCKLEKFLNENKHIDTVFLSFHYGALIFHVDNILGENSMVVRIPLHLTLLNKDEIAIFANRKMILLNSVFHSPYALALKFIMKGGRISYEDLGIGGHVKIKWNKLQEDIALQQNKQTEEENISFYQKEYLLKIADLCKSRNVKLILINPPTYKPEIYGNIDKLNNFHNTYLPEVTFWDCSTLPLPDDCYGDIGHLNYKGAEIFSKYLQEIKFKGTLLHYQNQ
ncbi:MAG: hypothetical protein LBS43_06055 [Prevotellaceae bacterium]|jgi:hypothetical protein|nr:hypothetical protein [Prevotellaceae bacterium]